jgi:hypothetical protein
MAGLPGVERAFRHVRVVDAVARLRDRWIVAVAGGEQMVGEEAEGVLDVGRSAVLEVGGKLVQDGDAGVGERGQLRVERVRAGQAEQPQAAGLGLRP